jgi:conjugative transposon TraK protein
MLKTLTNIDSVVKGYKLIVVVTLAISATIVVAATYLAFKMVRESRESLYVMIGDQIVQVRSVNIKENRPAEAEQHIINFHNLFFSLDPDDAVIKRNIGRSLYLADNSAKILHDKFNEDRYYYNLITSNISQKVNIDSVSLDMATYPYKFRCYAKQSIIRATSVVTRNLITEGALRDVQRSNNNAHGFLIERFKVIENKDEKVEKRF